MRRPPRCPRSDTLCPYTTLFRSRGRSERSFRTLQDRLPKELALAGITTVAAANRWLAETYIPQHNAAFAVTAEQDGSGFVPDHTGAWSAILCLKEERGVGNDNTAKWRRLHLQLPPRRLSPPFVPATVRVHVYPAGPTAVSPIPPTHPPLAS